MEKLYLSFPNTLVTFSSLHLSVILLCPAVYVTISLFLTLLGTDVLEPRPERFFFLTGSNSLTLLFSISLALLLCLILCLAHILYLRDLTGKGELHNMICHSLFNIWCQAFCSPHQRQSSVPMSLFLPFSPPLFLLILFPATLQSICLIM